MHLDLDFAAPVTPRHRLMCRVAPIRLGTTSVTYRVVGMQDGRDCFAGTFACVFVDNQTFTKRAPPDDMRAAVQAALRRPEEV